MGSRISRSISKVCLAATVLLSGGGVALAQSTVTLTAAPTSTTLPDGQTVPMWGYACGAVSAGVTCTAANGAAQAGGVWQPPLVTVPAGQPLTITLVNKLEFPFSVGTGTNKIPTSLVVVGQLGGGLGATPARMPSPAHAAQGTTWPGTQGAADPSACLPGGDPGAAGTFCPPKQVDRVRSFATEAAAAADGSSTQPLTWNDLRPGTYLIQSGTQPSIQVPMGLYGVLVVTEANTAQGQRQAYGTTFDQDVALLLSEIDPIQNGLVDTAVRTDGFSDTAVWSGQTGACGDLLIHTCYPPAVNYTPLYYLVNGVSFDRTRLGASTRSILPSPAAAPTGRVLLRFVNGGLRAHTPSVVGVTGMTLLAEDGNKLPGDLVNHPRVQSEVLLPPGKTHDVTIQPKQSGGNYVAATYAVFDRMLSLSTNNQRDGGMQAYVGVAGGSAAGAGSGASAVAATANPDTYYVVSGVPLTVSDPAKGVIANDVGIYGVAVAGGPVAGLTFNSDGTFTYTGAPGSFTYCGNGATSGPACAAVTLAPCTGTSCLGAPTANDDSYTSNVATRIQVTRPGVLANDSDSFGFPLNASAATNVSCGSVQLQPDGSFVATKGGGASCSFTYTAVNAKSTSSAPATVTVNFPVGSGLAVHVKDAKSGQELADYRWIIEEDRTVYIDPNVESTPGAPVRNVAINFHTSFTPVIAQGCTGPVSCESGQTLLGQPTICDVGSGACRTPAAGDAGPFKTASLPGDVALDRTKRYFISILPGDSADPLLYENAIGHAMGGAQIPAGQLTVDVIVQSLPIQTANISVFIFQDDNPLNGEADTGGGVDVLAPNEAGLGGFNIVLMDQAGAFGAAAGQLTYDMFGMPVSNALAGKIDPVTGLDACPISPQSTDGLVGIIVTCPKYESDGTTLSPLAGHAVIANMYPGMYEVQAVAGAERIARGEQWLQTNTLDGTKAIEVFIKASEPAYFQEFGPGGYHVAMGFANPSIIRSRKPSVCAGTAGGCAQNFYGQVTSTRLSRTPDQRTYSSGSYDIYSFTTCYASLSYPDAADFDFAFCDDQGRFEFRNIPAGNFKVTIFDQNNDLLVDGLSTSIRAGANLPGSGPGNRMQLPVMQWRTNLYGRVFLDTGNCSDDNGPGVAGDGVSQSCEPGLPLVPYNIRYRDGSYETFNNTDLNGYAGFNEIFPRLNWLVVDSDQARHKLAGVHVVYDAGGPVDGACTAGDGSRGCGDSQIAHMMANTLESPTAHVPSALRIPGSRYCADADCTGTGSFDPASGNAGSTGRVDPGWASTQGWQGLLGNNGFIEFALKPFKGKGEPSTIVGASADYGENGGIRGHVIYTSTRPFDDPALLLQLQWEPGIPNVKLNLYQKKIDDNGVEHLTLVDTTTSTSWDDWAQGFRRNADGSLVGNATDGYVPNMSCPGQETDSPFYFTMLDGKFPLDETKSLAARGRFKCYDGWSMLAPIQPAPYNGMYKFPSVVAKAGPTGQLPTGGPGNANEAPTAGNWFLQLDPKSFKTNCSVCTPNPDDGTPMLPPGTYVVEVIMPPGYELVKEEDKNILLGDAYVAPALTQFAGFGNIFIMPDQAAVNASYNPANPIQATANNGAVPRREGDTGSVEVFWPCVGEKRIVPDLISLYPAAGQQAPFAGATRPLCDRKEITLTDQMTALAKFYLFTSAHVASHFTGSITNDLASEFDPFSPQFGEKFAVPNLPVAIKDFSGREVGRVYGDQWGIYNGLTSSTWTVFPPSPSGYIPNMMIMCMNDPGPIQDTRAGSPTLGQMITDPAYSPAYSNFCYEIPYMPGQTSYLDTPVLPTMSFAAGYNLPDCEYPDTTPAIKMVQNSVGTGPWIDLGTPEVRASLSFDIGGVSQQSDTSTSPGDRINSVLIASTAVTSAVLRCGQSVAGSTAVNCTSSSQNTRNGNMAAALRANINANTTSGLAHGYSASGTGATVVITAPAGTGASANGRALTFNQTGLTAVTGRSLSGGVNSGPGTTTRQLTIASLGDKPVLNHAYSGPNATAAPFKNKFITRHYGFGNAQGTVTIGGILATIDSWTDASITVTVPGNVPACALQQRNQPTARCGQLEITAANGKKSIDTVTVTIGGKAPIYVTPAGPGANRSDTDDFFGRLEPSPLQTAIDHAAPGDLIVVGPGTYRDNLLLWKPVRLQGVGAESVTINADAHPAGKLDAWRRQVNCLFGLSLDGRPLIADGTFQADTYDKTSTYTCPAYMQQRVDRIPFETVLGWDVTGNGNLAQMIQEPTLMGAYEGAGITALGRGVKIPANSSDFWGSTTAGGFPAGYEYLTTRDCTSASTTRKDGRDYGTSNYLCNPSRVDGLSVINSSQGGGAIWAHAWNHKLEVSNNRVRANHGTMTGGITIGNGEFPDAFVVGGDNPPPPGHPDANVPTTDLQVGYQFNQDVRVHHNMVTANASIGDALYSFTPSAAGGITFCSGSDGYLLDHNWVCGNISYGDAGGVAHAGFINDGTIKNNWILFNQSQSATLPVNGGGLGVLGASPDRTLPDGTECGSTTDADCPPGLPEGTGRNLRIDANLIMGNSAESGTGGGIRLQMVNGQDVIAFPGRQQLWNDVRITNNIIANNVAGWDGGGISMQDALKVQVINNTIISNDTTASAGVLFKTLSAPMAATPPPNCDPGTAPGATCPDNINNTSTNQPAGLATMRNTPNMVAAIAGVRAQGVNVICPPGGYGYGTSLASRTNGPCLQVSLPEFVNNLTWHNRAFHVEVGSLGVGDQNQQRIVTLVPSLNQTVTGMCTAAGTANGAPGSGGPVNYWDIGVRGDTSGPTGHQSGFRIRPSNSILTSGDYAGNGNVIGTDPAVVALYCNGSRLPPEGGGLFAGFQAPAGRSETTGLYPVFSLNQTVAAPTVDEGNNWVNLTFGPLSLSNAASYTGKGIALPPLGDYRLTSGSLAAINRGTSDNAPTTDFFGNARSGDPDIGAVEFIAAPVAALRP